jgi:uncharacterized membrane protein YccC
MGEITVHTMALEELRARAREAERLIAQAREIARVSFDAHDDAHSPPSEGVDASRRVGLLLDAVQRLLPGMPALADERVPSSRAKRHESGWKRVTLRGGADRALDSLERAQLLERIVDDAAGLIAEIERRSSSVFRVADVAG